MSAHKQITICADDFALDQESCDAILRLAETGRISAVACFSDSPLWPEMGLRLKNLPAGPLIGLHFNLTQPFGYECMTLRRAIVDALTHRIDPRAVSSALERQIERFVSVVGALPDFIDGHEHVHALPVIADVVRRAANAARPEAPIPLRAVHRFFGPTDAPLKRWVIRALAALGNLGARAVTQRPLNTAFAGDYSLRSSASYQELFQSWLELAPEGALIMCHPRLERSGKTGSAGANELRFLESDAYADELNRYSLDLPRPISR
jgi:predicted glycoside hydrolase/deacetylase ChbG (UPF0249 family)